MRWCKSLLILILIFSGVGCSVFPERSYSDLMNEQEPMYVPDRDFNLALGDSGERYESLEAVVARTPAGLEDDSDTVSQEVRENYQLKRELASMAERQPPVFQEQYWQYQEQFRNDSERIYFLSLPSLQEREQYLESRAMKSDGRPKYLSELLNKEDHSEILNGMNTVQVRRIHGNPTYIESVNSDQNRWAYQLSRDRVRYIYFDRDQVQGWSEERVSP